jgi:hypothetical protein
VRNRKGPPVFGTALCLSAGVILPAAALTGFSCAQSREERAGAPAIVRHIRIHEEPGRYCAWPSVTRTAGGDLITLFCRSEEHLGPDGAILLTRSTDNGAHWQPAQVLFDTPIDDRECGLTMLKDGRILVHLWSTFHTPEFYRSLGPQSYEREVLNRWIRLVGSPAYRKNAERQGARTILSADGGRTWSEPVPGTDAVHGGIQLANGTLLVASYRRERDSVGVYLADRPQDPWRRIAIVRCPRPDSLRFGEPHILQLRSGRIIMMIRVTSRLYDDGDARCFLWETYSEDNGHNWAPPFPTPLWGFPPHLLQLSDGRVLCSYGHRRLPFGQRACISNDGLSWRKEDEVVLRDDAPNGDLGYPASVELEPGLVLTVYYQPNVPAGTVQRMDPPAPQRAKPGILGTVWSYPPRR